MPRFETYSPDTAASDAVEAVGDGGPIPANRPDTLGTLPEFPWTRPLPNIAGQGRTRGRLSPGTIVGC